MKFIRYALTTIIFTLSINDGVMIQILNKSTHHSNQFECKIVQLFIISSKHHFCMNLNTASTCYVLYYWRWHIANGKMTLWFWCQCSVTIHQCIGITKIPLKSILNWVTDILCLCIDLASKLIKTNNNNKLMLNAGKWWIQNEYNIIFNAWTLNVSVWRTFYVLPDQPFFECISVRWKMSEC